MLLTVLMFSSTIMAMERYPINETDTIITEHLQKDPIISSILQQGLATPEQIDFYQTQYSNLTTLDKLNDSLSTAKTMSRSSVYLTYNEYFTNVRWIVRDGITSLSITPNKKMFDASNANVLMARAFHSFSLLEDRFSSDYRWRNGASLSAQYHCHVIFAGMKKTPWNLEPHRTESNPWSWNMLTKRCNP